MLYQNIFQKFMKKMKIYDGIVPIRRVTLEDLIFRFFMSLKTDIIWCQ